MTPNRISSLNIQPIPAAAGHWGRKSPTIVRMFRSLVPELRLSIAKSTSTVSIYERPRPNTRWDVVRAFENFLARESQLENQTQ